MQHCAHGSASTLPRSFNLVHHALLQLGELHEHMGRPKDALSAFRRGHAYRRAVDLARREFPANVIDIEEEWGDWLAAQKQNDAAINHFIEAGQSVKAIEAAIQARQYAKAAGIIDFLDPARAMPYFKRIAQVRGRSIYFNSYFHLREYFGVPYHHAQVPLLQVLPLR